MARAQSFQAFKGISSNNNKKKNVQRLINSAVDSYKAIF